MSIAYTYEIIKVDEEARCMEIVYSADGYQTMHISARLPYVGESLLAVIDMFSPVATWEDLSRQCSTPAIGTKGRIAPGDLHNVLLVSETEEQRQERLNSEMWEQVNFEKRTAAALLKFGVLATNPTEIPVQSL